MSSANSWRRKAIDMYNAAVQKNDVNQRAEAVQILTSSGNINIENQTEVLQLTRMAIETAKRMPAYSTAASMIAVARAQLQTLHGAVAASLHFKLACLEASKGLSTEALHTAEQVLTAHCLGDRAALELASTATEVGIAYTEQHQHLRALEAIEVAVGKVRQLRNCCMLENVLQSRASFTCKFLVPCTHVTLVFGFSESAMRIGIFHNTNPSLPSLHTYQLQRN